MPKLKIGHGDWVVVCDGAKALVLENLGNKKFPNLQMKEVYEQEVPRTREQGTGPPGRSINSVGKMRSTIDQTDWHAQSERIFLERLAGHLNAAVLGGTIKALFIVASPRALGVLRQAYSHCVRSALRAEVDKDFVKLPVHEIEKHLVG